MEKPVQLELNLIEALDSLGGKGRTTDIYNYLANKLNLNTHKRVEKMTCGNYSKFENTVRWAKENLKLKGLVESVERGIWALTEKGTAVSESLKPCKPNVMVVAFEVLGSLNEPIGLTLWGEYESTKNIIPNDSINLIVTSPPYALNNPRAYGNASERDYIKWFLPIAELMKKQLTSDGSLILNLGPVYKTNSPTKSLYMYKLLISLVEELGFHLAGECYWQNPIKLPVTSWVTKKRIRLKDSIENIFWLSKSETPYADNNNVLEPYADSYRKELGTSCKPYIRPSGLGIKYFNKDNGGKIPGNLIIASNAISNDPYMRYCRKNNLPIHPARMPKEIPSFFIDFLTQVDDTIMDVFSGSNIVGEEAIKRNRRFIAIEKCLQYIQGSIGRFSNYKINTFI